MSHRDTLGLAKGPLQLPGLGRRRWSVTSQAAGCTADTGTPLATAGTLESLEHGRTLAATHLVGFFIASYHAHSLDERVAGVVDTRLDALVQGPAIWGCFVTEPGIDGWRQVAGHAVVVLPQVRVLSAAGGETDESFGARGPSGQGSSGERGQAALLVHASKGQPGVGRQSLASHSEGKEQSELRADIATRTRVCEQIWTGC